jgi:hypothetical protein
MEAISTGEAAVVEAGALVAGGVDEGADVGAVPAVVGVAVGGASAAFASPQIALLILSKIPMCIPPFRLAYKYLSLIQI